MVKYEYLKENQSKLQLKGQMHHQNILGNRILVIVSLIALDK